MSATVATAALGALGILAAFFGPTWRERSLERRRDRRDFRASRRLVAHELWIFSEELKLILDLGMELETPPEVEILVDRAWKEHQVTLAALLRDEELWAELSATYRGVVAMQRTLTIGVKDGEPLGEFAMDAARSAQGRAAAAAQRLIVAEPLLD